MTDFLDKDHPLSERKELESILETADEVSYTHHFTNDVLPERPHVSQDLIEEFLTAPESLEGFNYEEDDLEWPKYILLFDKSNKYWLRIVISLRESRIEVVTAHIASKRKNSTDSLLKKNP